MDGENNGTPYFLMDDLGGTVKPSISGNIPLQMGFWTTTLPLHPLLPLVALRLLAVKFFVLAGALGDAQLSDCGGRKGDGNPSQVI